MTDRSQPRFFPTALLLAGASAAATAVAFPYFVVLAPKLREMPVAAAVGVLALQTGLQALLFAWMGLRLGARVELGAPFVRRWLSRDAGAANGALAEPPRARWGAAAGLGALFGVITLVVDKFVFMPTQPEALRALASQVEPWRGLLVSFYGGVVEEVLLRLFLMTAFVWILAKVFPRRPEAIYVVAGVLAAVAFGLGHLPAAANIVPLTAVVVTRVVALNALGGIVFGLVYRRWGIEHAMLCHFCADVILHGVGS